MNSDGSRAESLNARAVLDAWRASGADRLNPLRFHLIDALDRRAAAYDGAVRQRLDERLAGLIAAYEGELIGAEDAAADAGAEADAEASQDAVWGGPLAELIAYLGSDDSRDPLGLRAAYPELPLLDEFRALWSRFSADRQVRQSQERVHKNAGPLNSNQLVHRALTLMREMSPGYLQQFLSYTDALMWMEQMTAAAAPAPKDAPRAGAAKKSTRAKPRKESKESKEA
ncbi:hypothetical protein LMG26690_00155 [Achromobacter animicus]|uniref:DUF2894 domain-containing protein n=1 Tax=Achromobacter animicus TaxID=1389935 RepID=A0A6S7A3F0_9BURK|nr:DUF2894 domain-containing protein [Achromobacter animicus]CAB3652983.1 hypothetical protein LMG26690_00155 [Achromobacter animicus]